MTSKNTTLSLYPEEKLFAKLKGFQAEHNFKSLNQATLAILEKYFYGTLESTLPDSSNLENLIYSKLDPVVAELAELKRRVKTIESSTSTVESTLLSLPEERSNESSTSTVESTLPVEEVNPSNRNAPISPDRPTVNANPPESTTSPLEGNLRATEQIGVNSEEYVGTKVAISPTDPTLRRQKLIEQAKHIRRKKELPASWYEFIDFATSDTHTKEVLTAKAKELAKGKFGQIWQKLIDLVSNNP